MPTDPRFRAYRMQRRTSKYRGIEFHISFPQWLKWWEDNLGPNWMKRRGKKANQFVMARTKDKGAYTLGNIKCIRVRENCRERRTNGTSCRGERNRHAKLNAKQVIEIFHTDESYAALAEQYKVSKDAINDIKKGLKWRHITGPLLKIKPHIDGRKLRWLREKRKFSAVQM